MVAEDYMLKVLGKKSGSSDLSRPYFLFG